MGKGEIARYEQFLLFPQCFQKVRFPGASKGVTVWEWVKLLHRCKVNEKDLGRAALVLQESDILNKRHSLFA